MNWPFFGSAACGHTAVLPSLIATCWRHAVEPFAYLRDVLTGVRARPTDRVNELLSALPA